MNKFLKNFLLALIILAIGFFLGRKTFKPKIEYVKGDPVHDTAWVDKPVYKEVPAVIDSATLFAYLLESHMYDYLLPDPKVDTAYAKVDTSAIIKEFITRNDYEITLFDNDTLGKMVIKPSVQFNQILPKLPYEFTPMVAVIDESPVIEPFIGGGLGYPISATAQLGFYTKTGLGFAGQYNRIFNANLNNYSILVLYKF